MNITCNNINSSPKVKEIINKYPNLISPHKVETMKAPNVYHRIETGSHPPVFSRPRQLSKTKFDIARDNLESCKRQELYLHQSHHGLLRSQLHLKMMASVRVGIM